MNALLNSTEYQNNAAFTSFLTNQDTAEGVFNAEDALPSTLSRNDALKFSKELNSDAAAVTPIACAYYPDWATSPSISDIDYSLFDIIFFGTLYKLSSLPCSMKS